ncbi:SDR family NAD(P)-dependent oxidoreductase [Nannocystis bainbridge]|uniref:SDR family NAD(P)-dependent oxidoreductase n=1 Tax=Nannocystis bainbridge TaxID=2995303 RepID=A0ABT5E091_9BACT|nr:SDR family NAD(P)-dependent oxidoreductase [Nannocystis bainbridge]MDC0719250.1 SDR family NAD(P)-dependent oxidoreductase [Nannocystis bainbridge]
MRHAIVFGATSAIAAEVCARWAARGDRLHLVGRDSDKLAAVAARCGAAEVTTAAGDFTDLARAEALAHEAVAALGGRVDVVLVAHGDLGDQQRSEHDVAEAARIVQTNFLSVVALLVPLANVLERQRSGTLAVITSVAGERGRPRNYTYGAAKGALHVYLQGLRSRLYPAGVTVTTLKLGPVDTPMTVGHPRNALFATPQRAARDIDRAIARRAVVAFVPWYWRPILFVVRHTPEPLFQRLGFLSGR